MKQKPELYDDVIELIEDEFGYAPPHKYDIDFYPLMTKSNWDNIHLICNENKVIAVIGCKIRTITLTKAHSFCLIGGVSVKKEHRGKGHFKRLISKVINTYRSECALFFLWSDLINLYKKFEFHLSIGLKESKIHLKTTKLSKVKLGDLSGNELSQVHALYENLKKQVMTFDRKKEDWDEIKKITSSDLYLRKDGDKILSYFFKNKGQDLDSVVHEVSHPIMLTKKDITLSGKYWLPEESKLNEKSELNYMALVRLADDTKLNDFIVDWSNDKISIKEISRDVVTISYNQQPFEIPSNEFLCYLFGPGAAEEFQGLGKPFYISGLDSI